MAALSLCFDSLLIGGDGGGGSGAGAFFVPVAGRSPKNWKLFEGGDLGDVGGEEWILSSRNDSS